MIDDLSAQPVEVLGHPDHLKKLVEEDMSGERVRHVVAWLAQAGLTARQTELRSTDFEDRQLAALLSDGYAAAHRVVMAAWCQQHRRELPL